MYIDKYQTRQEEFKNILNYVLNKQPGIFILKDIEFKNIDDECWCKVYYTNDFAQENHFWVNDYRAYSLDKSINISALNRDYTRQIYLNNAKNASLYIYNYNGTKTQDLPPFLANYRTAPKVTIKQTDPFMGIKEEDIINKAIFYKYISPSTTIDDNVILDFLSNNKEKAANIVQSLAHEYSIPCSKQQAKDQIERIFLEKKQKNLNKDIQKALSNSRTCEQKVFDQAKNLVYIEKQIDEYENTLQQLEFVYRSTSKLNTESLKIKIQNYSLENPQLMKNDFYRTIFENILILEQIKRDTKNFDSYVDYDKYWTNLSKNINVALTNPSSSYLYDTYTMASIMANHLEADAGKYKSIFYNELLTEQAKIINSLEKSPVQINNTLGLNYMILAEELKKLNSESCLKVTLFANAYIKYHNLSQPQIIQQYENEVNTIKNQIEITKAIKASKIKECKKSAIEIKDLLQEKALIDKKIEKVQSFDGFYGIDDFLKLDFENTDINVITNEVLSNYSANKHERSA